MDERAARTIWQRRLAAYLSLAFGGLALALAVFGLYGVLSYVVGQQRREFGIRTALGAPRGRLIGVVLWRGLQPTVTGVALGSALAALLTAAMRPLVLVEATGLILSFAAVAALLMSAAVMACLPAALRVVRADPASTLRAL